MCIVAAMATVGFGLASRRYPGVLPGVFGKYPGDALWAAVVFFGWAALRPRAGTRSVALLACASCVAIELLKLWQAPWLVSVRHTTLGHLVFGHVFSVRNLAAYVVGILIAMVIDVLWLRRTSMRSRVAQRVR